MLRTDETITLGVPIPVGFQEKDDGTLQIELYQGTGWPDGLVHALTWLENRGYSLEKWFPKKTFLLCYELNPSNQIVSTYKRWFDQLIKLEGGISVGYQPDWQAGKTIAVFNTRRIWPWALAVGVVVYAGLWRVANVKKKSKQCHPA